MKRAMTVLVLTAALAACGSNDDRIPFDGQIFNAKAKKVEGQFDTFTVTVKGVSKSLDGARQAGEYEGVRYCVNTYGNSDIAWTVGPETPAEQLRIENDTLVYSGVCPQARAAQKTG